jgi:hypothetical protein
MWAALTALAGLTQIAAASLASADTTTPTAVVVSQVIMRLAPSAIVGQPFEATVVVLPRERGQVVVLQRQGSQRWRNLGIKATSRLGRVTFQYTFKTIGQYAIRAVVASPTAGEQPASHVIMLHVEPTYAAAPLRMGQRGAAVLALQQRLSALGYWLGNPDGYFGDATEQAVYALQKSAGLKPSGVVDAPTDVALESGALPKPRSTSGYVVEVDLHRELLMIVRDGRIVYVLNTSTGGGYPYVQDGVSSVAITPTGTFHINRAVDGLVIDSLGALWRPRFFYEGFAIHGDSYVPPIAASHGCARISNEAIDWIWAQDLLPFGTTVWVY